MMNKGTYNSAGRFIRDTGGVAAIEFALIVPMLALMLVATADYAMFIDKKNALQRLSRKAVEYVVQGGQESTVAANIIEADSLFTTTTEPITYTAETQCECANATTVDCQGNCPGDDYMRSFYAVTISGTYTPIIPYPGLDDSISLQGYSRIQYAR